MELLSDMISGSSFTLFIHQGGAHMIEGQKECFWANGEKDHIATLTREYEKTLLELRVKKKCAKDAASRALIAQQMKEVKHEFRTAMLSAKRSLW